MTVEVQNNSKLNLPIKENEIIYWVENTLNKLNRIGDICICIVDEPTMTNLNLRYRNQKKPTNVLSFPSELPKEIQYELNILGDMIICPTVLAHEAIELNKPIRDHWAHICIHGVLHLLGYDHIEEKEAVKMQTQEIEMLSHLNFSNPYCKVEGDKLEH